MDDLNNEQQANGHASASASMNTTSPREKTRQAEGRQCTERTSRTSTKNVLKTKTGRSVNSGSSRSSSSSSSASSSSSSSSPPCNKAKRSRRRRRRRSHCKKRKGGKHNQDASRLDKISQDIDELRKHLTFNNPNNVTSAENCGDVGDDSYVADNVSGILYNEIDESEIEQNQPSFQFNFDLETKLKESAIPKTPNNLLKILNDIQYFDKSEWSEVRYAEVQKLYNHTPGFVELDTNDEVKSYDQLRNLSYTDKAYAALSNCILIQREALQTNLKDLITWARNENNFSAEGMHEKINELFSKGEYSKVSADLLQMVCGHRAEIIQMRRHGLINSIRDPLLKSAVRKIPPSNKYLFNDESFTSFLEKNGGVRKVFMPNKAKIGTVSQAGTSKGIRYPSQGSADFHGLSQSIINQGGSSRAQPQQFFNQPSQGQYYNQPSQGYYYNRPSQGQPPLNATHRVVQAARGSFRSRGAHTSNRGQNKNERKRPGNTTDFHPSNKRRRY